MGCAPGSAGTDDLRQPQRAGFVRGHTIVHVREDEQLAIELELLAAILQHTTRGQWPFPQLSHAGRCPRRYPLRCLKRFPNRRSLAGCCNLLTRLSFLMHALSQTVLGRQAGGYVRRTILSCPFLNRSIHESMRIPRSPVRPTFLRDIVFPQVHAYASQPATALRRWQVSPDS